MAEIKDYFAMAGFCTLFYNMINNTRILNLEKKRYWFRTHIIRNGFKYIDDYFLELLLAIEKYKNNELRIYEFTLRIKTGTRNLKDQLTILKFFKYNKWRGIHIKIYSILFVKNIYEDIQNMLTEFEEKIFLNQGKEFHIDWIQDTKNKLKEELYRYELRNYR